MHFTQITHHQRMDERVESLVRKLKRVKHRPDPSDLEKELEERLLSENVRGQVLKLSIEKQRELLDPHVAETRQLEKQRDELAKKLREKYDLCGEMRNRISNLEWERVALGRRLREDLMDEEDEDEDE